MTAPIVRQALYLEVADRLRDMIRSHALVSGAWIDEVALTGVLGISRTPLREALKVLATEGLVRLEPRRGCFVNELSLQDLEDIFPLMAMLEGRCAYEATVKASDAQIAALDSLHQSLQAHAAAGEMDAYYDTNAQIHETIQTLANNHWLSDTVGTLRKVLSLFRHKSLILPGRINESCAEHMAIYAALKARNPEAAQALASEHLMRQLDALRVLAQRPDSKKAGTARIPDAPSAKTLCEAGRSDGSSPFPSSINSADIKETAHEHAPISSARARRSASRA